MKPRTRTPAERAYDRMIASQPSPTHGWRCGFLCRWASAWIGVHYSNYNKRWCINLIPFVTLWVCAPGGKRP